MLAAKDPLNDRYILVGREKKHRECGIQETTRCILMK